MKVLMNIVLTVCALLIIAVVLPVCLVIAIIKKCIGNEPILYSRYIEE